MTLVRVLAALVAIGCGWLLCFWAASRLWRREGVTTRLAAGSTLMFWLAAWVFEVLALVGRFELTAIVPLCVLLPAATVVVLRRGLGEEIGRSCRQLQLGWRSLWQQLRGHPWIAACLALVGVQLVVRVARTLVTPALGWDDFTYHLFRAGRWVQNGGLKLEPAPDAWTYYEFFPWGGDLIWAWGLVWRQTEVLIPVLAVALWCLVVLAAFALARTLGQGPLVALVVAFCLGMLPSQISQIHTTYVDNAVLLQVLVASLFLVLLGRSRSPGEVERLAVGADGRAGFMIGAACGLGLLVKTSFLPLLVPAGLLVAWRSWVQRRGMPMVAFLTGASVAAPNLLYNTVHRGSPFYPFRVVDGLPYNEQLAWVLGRFGWTDFGHQVLAGVKALVRNVSADDPFLNVGWLGVLLSLLGIAATLRMLRRGENRLFVIWLLVGAMVTCISFFSPRNSSMVTLWANVMGRFLVPGLAGLLVAAGLAPVSLIRSLLVPVLVVESLIYAPWQWPSAVLGPSLGTLGMMALIAAVTVIVVRRRVRPFAASLLGCFLVAACLVFTAQIRDLCRWESYRLFAAGSLGDFHRAPPAGAWPLWQRLDGEASARVAATAGFDGITGHNWFRAPLLGSRLQHEVVYVPITADGELVSYTSPSAVTQVANRRAWLERLERQRVTWVAALGPRTIEHSWLLELPQVFKIELMLADNEWILASIDQQQLTRHLALER